MYQLGNLLNEISYRFVGKIPSTIWDSGKNKFKHGVIAKRQERELTDLDTKLFDHDKIEFALVIVGG